MEATITSKGQITLPKILRDLMHLDIGDKIIFAKGQNQDEYVIKPKTISVKSLAGCVKYTGEPVTLEEMDTAIAEGCKDI